MENEEKEVKKVRELTHREYMERAKKVRSLETDPLYIQMIEDAERRRSAVPPRVEKQYRREGAQFYAKDGDRGLMFEDRGDRLKAKKDDERTAHAIVAIAEARGWSKMEVKGSEEFRRNVWKEGVLHGIHVDGYSPTSQEREEIEKQKYWKQQKEKQEKEKGKEATTTCIEGKLVSHGEAPLGFNKEAQSSYYITVETAGGKKTIWGDGLAHSIRDSQARNGDNIHLEYMGRGQASPVHEKERSPGEKERDRERAQVLLLATGAVIAAKIKSPALQSVAASEIQKKIDQRLESGRFIPDPQIYGKSSSVEKVQKPDIEQSPDKERGIER